MHLTSGSMWTLDRDLEIDLGLEGLEPASSLVFLLRRKEVDVPSLTVATFVGDVLDQEVARGNDGDGLLVLDPVCARRRWSAARRRARWSGLT